MAAGTSIFTLLGEVFIDNEKANQSIQKTDTLAGKLGKGLGKGIKTAGKWGLALGTAAVGAGAAMFGAAKKSADALDTIHKGSQRMGVTTKAYQEMEYWASQNGLAQNDMEKAAGRLNQRLGEAAAGNKKYSGALEQLGVDMDAVREGTVSTEDAFATSIQTLSGMTNEQEKAALASELFGTKLAREMLPALNDSSLSFEDAQKKAQELGIVLDEEAVNAGANFSDSMDDVKRSLGAVGTNIGASVMPMFQKMLDWILDHMPQIQEVFKVVFEKIGDFVNIAIDIFKDYLLPIFQNVYDWVKENWPAIQKIIEGVFKAVEKVWENVLKPVLKFLLDTFKTLVNWTKDHWPTIKSIIEGVFSGIKKVWESIFKPVLDLISSVLKSIVDWVKDHWPAIQKAFEVVFGAIETVWENVLKPVLDFLLDGFKAVVDFVAEKFEKMQETVESVFSGIGKAVDAVKDSFEWLTEKIKDAWNWLTTWNKTDAKDKSVTTTTSTTDNNRVHATNARGIAHVPFNGYKSQLHEGEAVLTAEENEEYKKRTDKSINQTINIYSPKALSPAETARENKKALQKLALAF